MIATLPYGPTAIEATLPDRTVVLYNEEPKVAPVDDLDAAVREALADPVGLGRIRDLVTPGASVAIAFDDATVPAYGPIRRVAIEAVLEELESAGVPRRNVTLICANALHRMFRPEELARLIGDDLVREFGPRLICHDAEDRANLIDLGTTSPHGYPVEVHRLAVESDLLVYVNARYLRGFSGGWKSVVVGLSTYRTIKLHHTPYGMSMSLHGNQMARFGHVPLADRPSGCLPAPLMGWVSRSPAHRPVSNFLCPWKSRPSSLPSKPSIRINPASRLETSGDSGPPHAGGTDPGVLRSQGLGVGVRYQAAMARSWDSPRRRLRRPHAEFHPRITARTLRAGALTFLLTRPGDSVMRFA